MNFRKNINYYFLICCLFFCIILFAPCKSADGRNVTHLLTPSINLKIFSDLFEKHFDKHRETYVYYTSGKSYNFDKLIKLLQIKMNNGVIIEKYDGMNNVFHIHYDINVLFINVKWVFENDFHTNDNLLLFFDQSNVQKCNITEIFHYRFFKGIDTWKMFRTLVLIRYHKNCLPEYKVFYKKPWSKDFRQINHCNYEKVYFHKPNFHGKPLTVRSIKNKNVWNKTSCLRDTTIEETLWVKWNTSKYYYQGIEIFIAGEPVNWDNYTNAYHMMSLCFVVHKRGPREPWDVLPRSFHWHVWLASALTICTTTLAWFALRIVARRSQATLIHLIQSYSQMNQLFWAEPIEWLNKIETNSEKILSITIMLMSIVLISGLQSSLYSLIQSPGSYPEIKTLRDIKQANLTILCKFAEICQSLFSKGQINRRHQSDPLLKEIGRNWVMNFTKMKLSDYTQSGWFDEYDVEMLLNMTELNETAEQFHTIETLDLQLTFSFQDVFLDNKNALMLPCEEAYKVLQTNVQFRKELIVVDEIVGSFPLYYKGLNRELIFPKHLRKILLSFYESGIAQWLDHIDEWRKLMRILIRHTANQVETNLRVFKLKDLQGAFLVLIIGLVFALVIFTIEMTSRKFRSRSRVHNFPFIS